MQLSMIRIYEEKRDISKHRKFKKKTPHFFGITIKKGKPRKTKVPSGDAHGKYDFFLGGVNLQTALATMNAINAYN